MSEKVLASIDIGTNSFHLVVAKADDKGIIKILTRDKEVVRLGKSSSDMKYLTQEAMDRAITTLKRFKLICDSYNAEIRAVATSATREALNRDVFLNQVIDQTGIHVEVVSGFEEARLIYLGLLQALPVFEKQILMIDIGGGSTEFLAGQKGNVIYANSIKIGAVRLTEKYFKDGKIKKENIEKARTYVRSIINPVIRQLKNIAYESVIGSSGTILNIGSIIYADKEPLKAEQFNFNNFTYTAGEFNEAVKKIIKAETPSNIKNIEGLDPSRADIITAGAIILEQIFSELKIKEITLSTFALREGILFDTIDKEHSGIDSEDLKNVRYRSIINLATRCNYDESHVKQILRFAVKIFDTLKDSSGLEENDKECLEAACILHDIGHSISHSQHHRHSYYLIRNSELLGFNDEEIEMIANVARYHRKSHPKAKHNEFEKLNPDKKVKVKMLAGILRIADGLDRGHSANVKNIQLSISDKVYKIGVVPEDSKDVTLEIWGANLRKELFEEIFGYTAEITQANNEKLIMKKEE
ncbi:Ppx/GppA family phosphatase [bacterium]|nr:MAG: Ppx/GppA family phosphatase [bacterium]